MDPRDSDQLGQRCVQLEQRTLQLQDARLDDQAFAAETMETFLGAMEGMFSIINSIADGNVGGGMILGADHGENRPPPGPPAGGTDGEQGGDGVTLGDLLSVRDAEIARLQLELRQVVGECLAAREAAAEGERMRRENEELRAQLLAGNAEGERMRSELARLREELCQAVEQCRASRGMAAGCEDLAKQNDGLRQQVEAGFSVAEQLRADLASLKKRLTERDAECGSLGNELVFARKALAGREAELAATQREVEASRVAVSVNCQTREEMVRLDAELREAREGRAKSTGRLADAKAREAELRGRMEKIERRWQRRCSEVVEWGKNVEAKARKEVKNLERALASAIAARDRALRERDEALAEYGDQRRRRPRRRER